MRFEVDIRIPSDLTPEQLEEIKEYELIDENFDRSAYMDQNQRYEYTPVHFDVEDVTLVRMLDEDHTVISTETEMFIAHIPYHIFNSIYEELTGKRIKRMQDFDFEIEIQEFLDGTAELPASGRKGLNKGNKGKK